LRRVLDYLARLRFFRQPHRPHLSEVREWLA
jgi:hypothetical protein